MSYIYIHTVFAFVEYQIFDKNIDIHYQSKKPDLLLELHL